jgi:hypothetical protein
VTLLLPVLDAQKEKVLLVGFLLHQAARLSPQMKKTGGRQTKKECGA